MFVEVELFNVCTKTIFRCKKSSSDLLNKLSLARKPHVKEAQDWMVCVCGRGGGGGGGDFVFRALKKIA